ncbi:MAG: hypothetical protein D6741_02925 [Planctomycetota bacterium]|nr:MAG: hypothetical protein D6741_02925 [Planctomycetota bacterium]
MNILSIGARRSGNVPAAATLLFGVAALALLSGCPQSNDGPASPSEASSETTEPAPPHSAAVDTTHDSAEPAAGNSQESNAAEASEGESRGIRLVLDVPEQAEEGDDIPITWTIVNESDSPLEGAILRSTLFFGLRDTITDAKLEQTIPRLAPGDQTTLTIVFHATTAGTWQVRSNVEHDNQSLVGAEAVLPVDEAPEPEPIEEKPVDLGPPLVDDLDRLQRLDPTYPVWVDPEKKAVVMVGTICQRQAPLELFACLRQSKEHESIVTIDTKAFLVHAGLLAIGLEPGHPVQFYPEYVPAEGPEVDIEVVWKDENGKIHRARAQDWVRRISDGTAMDYPWVFTGSQFLQDEETGKKYYYADSTGELICVSNFPASVLDLPVESTSSNEGLLFEAFTERIPPLGTPVTLILTAAKTEASSAPPETPASPEAEDAQPSAQASPE